MVYLHWMLILTYLIIIIGTIVIVLLGSRQSSKTVMWLLVLIFLPIVGIILYFFFGQNARKQCMMSQRSIDQLTKRLMLEFTEQGDLALPERYQPLTQLFANQSMSSSFKDNEVEIYTEGADSFPGLFEVIGSAKHHTHTGTYIVREDPLSRLIAGTLIDKAQEGIKVHLIYDCVSCWRVPGRYFERLRNVGVDVRSSMPVYFPTFTDEVDYRNHCRLVVVDGQADFIGSTSIAMHYIRGSVKQP